MFCPKCGQEMLPQARFCAHCGADIQDLLQQSEKTPPVSQKSGPEIPNPQNASLASDAPVQEIHEAFSEETGVSPNTSDSDPLAAIIGKNQAYYISEFQKIQSGEKSRFNWATFFFGPAFCFYRKCEDLFKKYFLIPISLTFVGYIVQTIGTVRFNLMLTTIGGVISGVGGILGVISLIRLGFRFNQLYYERCSGPVSPNKFGTSIKAAAAFYIVIVLVASLIGGAGIMMIRHQFSSAIDPDPSDISDIWTMPSGSGDQNDYPTQTEPIDPPTEIASEFDDVIGLWENENGNGDSLYIFYGDETAQQAYAEVITDEAYFVAELTRVSGEYIHGVSPETEDSSTCEIELNWIGNGFDTTIYYDEYFVDYITFVPYGQGSAADNSNDIPYSDYNLYLYEGSYYEDSGSIDLTLSVVPNGTSFACELFWNYGKLLELGTVRPGVPTLLSEGTTITIDLEPSGNINVLLEGDDLLDGSYSFYMMKND